MSIRFDGFELDPIRFQLKSEGKKLKVEPLVLDLLIHLIHHRDRVVSKEELIEIVWKGRFVGDSAVSRAIYETRKTLGEDSKNARRIKTVHGRGYRFAGEIESEEVTPSISPAPNEARRRFSRSWIWASALVFAALLSVSTMRTDLLQEDRPVDLEPKLSPAIALLPIQPDVSSSELQLIGLSLTDLLFRRLGQIEGLRVRAPSYDTSPALESASLEDFAREAGASFLLTGSLSSGHDPDKIRASLELVEFGKGTPLTTPLIALSLPFPDSEEHLATFLEFRDAAVDEVLLRLEPALSLPSLDTTRPSDSEAYRLALLAYRSMLESFCDGRGAIELLERSLEIDPHYAPSWELLAVAHYNQVWACGSSPAAYDLALEATGRAIEIAPDAVSPRLIQNTILVEQGRVEEAYAVLTELREHHRDIPESLKARMYALRYAGFLDEAGRLLDQLLEMDPHYHATGASGEAPNTLLYRGEFTRFLSVLPDSDSAYHRYYRGLAELARGNVAAARIALEPAFRESPAEIFGRYSQALLAIIDGDLESARIIVAQVALQRRSLGVGDGEMTYKEAQIQCLAGDRKSCLTDLELAVEQGFFCGDCFRDDPFLLPLRQEARYAAILEQVGERQLAFAARFGLASP